MSASDYQRELKTLREKQYYSDRDVARMNELTKRLRGMGVKESFTFENRKRDEFKKTYNWGMLYHSTANYNTIRWEIESSRSGFGGTSNENVTHTSRRFLFVYVNKISKDFITQFSYFLQASKLPYHIIYNGYIITILPKLFERDLKQGEIINFLEQVLKGNKLEGYIEILKLDSKNPYTANNIDIPYI